MANTVTRVRQRPLDDDEMTAWRAYTETAIGPDGGARDRPRPATA